MSNIETQRPTQRPFFSIGVTTYNRKDMLKQTVSSILNQSFSDFEVIIGNDYTGEVLTNECLGINDSRVVIVNNKINIGELENMNALLNAAQGRYFTWQFDDDPCAPCFLSEMYSALAEYGFPQVVFSSFSGIYGVSGYRSRIKEHVGHRLYSGYDFLGEYLSGKLRALGCCGCYDAKYLRDLGGVNRLSDGPMALHSEYLLLIQSGLLPRIAYVDAPLVMTRVHESSWSCSNSEVELFQQAGINLVRKSIEILLDDSLVGRFQENLSSVLRAVINAVALRGAMLSVRSNIKMIREYIFKIEDEFASLKGTKYHRLALVSLDMACNHMPIYAVKAKIRKLIPFKYLRHMHIIKSFVSRYTGEPF